MMTPDMMAQRIARAFSVCRRRSQLSVDALAKRSGGDVAIIKMIENADFDECFKIHSVERRMCDAIKLTPSICIEIDDGIIF